MKDQIKRQQELHFYREPTPALWKQVLGSLAVIVMIVGLLFLPLFVGA